MEIFSVGKQQREVVEQLILIQKSEYKKRKGYIKQLEKQGYVVDYVGGVYQARSGSAPYRIPLKKCPSCGERKYLHLFLTQRDVEHPWCQHCRHNNRSGAEQARLEQRYHLERGTLQVGILGRCQNPDCPNGGIIPEEKLRRDQRFCCRQCWRAVNTGSERFCKCGCGKLLHKDQNEYSSMVCKKNHLSRACANSDCPDHNMVMPPRKYCSRSCFGAYMNSLGHYQEISEIGNEVQFLYKQENGEIPHYTERAAAVSANNKANPPRRKKTQVVVEDDCRKRSLSV